MSLPSQTEAITALDTISPNWRQYQSDYAGITGRYVATNWTQALQFLAAGGKPSLLEGVGRGVLESGSGAGHH